jgi:type IV pilus assembly protein PilN
VVKVNLLKPGRPKREKKRRDIHLQAAVGLTILLLSGAGCGYMWVTISNELDSYEREKQEKEKQLAVLKEKTKQVQEFEQRKKLLEDKNRIIEQLKKDQGGPVKALDYVSQSLEPLKIWLVRLHAKGNEVEVEGRALTNDDVVEFVSNLRKTDHFSQVRLLETRSGLEAKVTVYQFRVNLTQKV